MEDKGGRGERGGGRVGGGGEGLNRGGKEEKRAGGEGGEGSIMHVSFSGEPVAHGRQSKCIILITNTENITMIIIKKRN